MSIEFINQNNTRWMIDWRLVAHLVRSSLHDEAINKFSVKQITDSTKWHDFWSWADPEIVTYQTDWSAVKTYKQEQSEILLAELYLLADEDFDGFKVKLNDLIIHAENERSTYIEKLRAATRE